MCVKLDNGHPCYGQLKPVKKGYAPTSVIRLYRWLKYTTHRRDQLLVLIDRRLNYFRCLILIAPKRPYN